MRQANTPLTEFTGYAEAVDWVQRNFTGMVGQGVYDYVVALHRRIGRYERWSKIHGFNNWDWGAPRGKMGLYEIRVWLKDTPIFPNDIDPVINIRLNFGAEMIKVLVTAGRKVLLKESDSVSHSASSIALEVGAAWERLLTGSVDYGE